MNPTDFTNIPDAAADASLLAIRHAHEQFARDQAMARALYEQHVKADRRRFSTQPIPLTGFGQL